MKKAADKGHIDAQYNLGFCYAEGKGIEEDFKKAFEYWKKAADSGNADAQYNIGCCYIGGLGVEKADQRKAIEYWEKAANQGLDAAKEALKKLGN